MSDMGMLRQRRFVPSCAAASMRVLSLNVSWRFRDSLCESNYVPVRVLDCELAHSEPLGSERHDHLYMRCSY